MLIKFKTARPRAYLLPHWKLLFFSGYIEFGGVAVKFYSSVEITLYFRADFLLQYVTLFQSRDIVKNLVSF